MSLDFLRDPSFFAFLLAIDHELADEVRRHGCPSCRGTLHCANYPRSPSGGPNHIELRLSFCCATDGCRKRCTPASVRFLGRKVYLGVIVVLASTLYHGLTAHRRDRLEERLGVSERTLVRWRRWWLKEFAHSRFWSAMRRHFLPPVEVDALPASLLKRFCGDERAQVIYALRFLSPITGGKGFVTHCI